jgi:pyruvate dehydrogenase E1 component alpha subunit
MAQLWKLPIIFVVENNLWAIGMSHLRATSDPEIWKKGPAFGMPGVHVDGMDVLKVREVAKEAIDRARRGEGPTLVEAETYRFRGHSLADPDELRRPGKIAFLFIIFTALLLVLVALLASSPELAVEIENAKNIA